MGELLGQGGGGQEAEPIAKRGEEHRVPEPAEGGNRKDATGGGLRWGAGVGKRLSHRGKGSGWAKRGLGWDLRILVPLRRYPQAEIGPVELSELFDIVQELYLRG